MDNAQNIQAVLFQEIKSKLSPNVSFVHVVAELLDMSYDSAYRRIRGEKSLTLEELYKISAEFKISIDTFLNIDSNNCIFSCYQLEHRKFKIKQWLAEILFVLKKIGESPHIEIIFAAKDPPLFHYFQFPEIASFKMFFYEKTLLRFPEYQDKLFKLDDFDPEVMELGKRILAKSTILPTTEIWNEDTFRITLRQIEYYWIAGYFAIKEDVFRLCDALVKWIKHTQKQAELGFKFIYGHEPTGIENTFKLYENEVVLNDDSIFVKTDYATTTYLTFNVLGLLITSDKVFCGYVEDYLRGLLKESVLISVTGAKERNRFFNKLRSTVDDFRQRIS